MNMRRFIVLLPVLLFVVLAVFLARRLLLIAHGDAPNIIPSAMIDHPAPAFTLPSLYDDQPPVTMASLKGHVTLIDIFASWCVPCQVEHPLLADIKQAGIVLVGLNYKDQPTRARQWLENMGNPYDVIASDLNGRVAIDFGAYGVPESYLLDKQGVIRFKQTGPLTPEIIRDQILPLAEAMNE